jgi:hypothetical protein
VLLFDCAALLSEENAEEDEVDMDEGEEVAEDTIESVWLVVL